jgi:predicted acyltransferase
MNSDLRNRLAGLLFFAAGGALGWWGIWLPLQAARAQVPEVRYHLEIFALVPLTLVFGLFLVIAGDKLPYRDAARNRLTPTGWMLFAIIAICAAGSFFWLKSSFAELGYQG